MKEGSLKPWATWQRLAYHGAVVESAGVFPRLSGIECPNLTGGKIKGFNQRCKANLLDTKMILQCQGMERRISRCETCGFVGCKLTGRNVDDVKHSRCCVIDPTRLSLQILCGSELRKVYGCSHCGDIWCAFERLA